MISSEEQAIELWMDHLAGELDDHQAEELKDYLGAHPELSATLRAEETIWSEMGRIPTPEPTASMDLRFEAMLSGYKQANERNAAINWWPVLQDWVARSWRVGLASLAIGLTLGWALLPSGTQKSEIATLSTEVAEMKKMMMLTMIEQPEAQQRIHAVSMVEELPDGDEKIILALSNTLNQDPNINVRLAALEALTGYWNQPLARTELVQAIGSQESPLVQSEIADAMISLREKTAIGEFEKLLADPELNSGVKVKIESTIQKLKQI